MGRILVNRFARSLGESEQLNAELAQRVEAKRVELEQNYRRLHAPNSSRPSPPNASAS